MSSELGLIAKYLFFNVFSARYFISWLLRKSLCGKNNLRTPFKNHFILESEKFIISFFDDPSFYSGFISSFFWNLFYKKQPLWQASFF